MDFECLQPCDAVRILAVPIDSIYLFDPNYDKAKEIRVYIDTVISTKAITLRLFNGKGILCQ